MSFDYDIGWGECVVGPGYCRKFLVGEGCDEVGNACVNNDAGVHLDGKSGHISLFGQHICHVIKSNSKSPSVRMLLYHVGS